MLQNDRVQANTSAKVPMLLTGACSAEPISSVMSVAVRSSLGVDILNVSPSCMLPRRRSGSTAAMAVSIVVYEQQAHIQISAKKTSPRKCGAHRGRGVWGGVWGLAKAKKRGTNCSSR
jgi:hypothetical protein